jgi:hypothetical protein
MLSELNPLYSLHHFSATVTNFWFRMQITIESSIIIMPLISEIKVMALNNVYTRARQIDRRRDSQATLYSDGDDDVTTTESNIGKWKTEAAIRCTV